MKYCSHYCTKCWLVMKRVYRFENGKSYSLYKCPKCHTETKPQKHNFFNTEAIRQNNSKTTNKNTKRKGIKK